MVIPQEVIILSLWASTVLFLGGFLMILNKVAAWYERKRAKMSKDMQTWDNNFPEGMENDDF